jgi:tetratricopeptide (TPR) repeat protein
MNSAGRRRIALRCVLLAGITAAAFLPSLDNGFVNRDDPEYVVNNLDLRGFSGRNLAELFSSVYVNHYLPVTMLTYMAEYALFGLDARGFHLTSLLVHVINVLLVFALLYWLSGSLFVAAAAALLFGIHPLRVEAVAWVAERKEVLSALFYLSSLLLYLAWRTRGGRHYYLLSLAALLVSLLSKTMSVSQPFVLVLIDYLSGRTIDRKSLLEKLPFFALAAVFAAVAVLTVERFHDLYAQFPALQRALVPAYAAMFYIVKFFAPLGLSASYFPPLSPDTGLTVSMVSSAAVLAVIAAAVIYSRRFTRTAVFGSLFFIVTMLPVLQIVNSGGIVITADRYTYVPLIGVCFAAAAGLDFLRKRLTGRAAAAALYVVLAGAAASLFALTWKRCDVWKDSLALWNDIIARPPANAQAYYGRGGALRDIGRYGEALADFNRALELNPGFAGAYFGRGYMYCAFLGKTDSALADLGRAVALAPRMPDAWNALGIAEGMKGNWDAAVSSFTRAIGLKPDFVEAYVNRGNARMQGPGGAGGAAEDFTKAITLDPAFARAFLLRGVARGMLGLSDNALSDFDRAAALDPALSAAAAQYRAMVKKGAGQ